MENTDEIMVERIKNVLSGGYKEGINPLFTAAYIKGESTSLNSTMISKLAKLMVQNNITIPQVKEFIDQKEFDIFYLINQVEQDNEYIFEEDEEGINVDKNILNGEIDPIDPVEEIDPNKEIEIIDLDEEEKEVELSEKAKKLQEKVDLLCEKVEQEKSPLKRHILTFKIKMLVSKIQREIDLQNIKEKYELKRQRLERRKQDKETISIEKIADLDEDIKYLEKVIKGNEEYDYKSNNFLYPKQYVETLGGINEFPNKLKQSNKQSVQKVAERIEIMSQARQELDNLREKLKEEQQKLDNNEQNYNRRMNEINFSEKSLILANKVNIFSRVGNFFSTMVQEAKSYWQERKELKQLDLQQKQETIEIDEEENNRIQAIREEMDKKFKELEEEMNAKIEKVQEEQAIKKTEMQEQQKAEKEELIMDKNKSVVEQFRSKYYVAPEQMIEDTTVKPLETTNKEVTKEELEGQEPGK